MRAATSHLDGSMRSARIIALGAVGVVVLSGACAKKQVEAWTPRPQVAWKDLARESIPAVTNAYRVLVSQPTKGLFPSRIAVMRVAQAETGRFHLVRDPRNEFLRWNTAFDDQMAVSEVFPIAQRDLAGAEATPEHLMAANRALRARIGLVYAFNQRDKHESEMIGLLYDSDQGAPIAAFHAEATSLILPEEEEDEESVDLWKTDSTALVRAKFERIVYNCVRDLIRQDVPAEVEAPSGWTPVGPIRPVEWPPRFRR